MLDKISSSGHQYQDTILVSIIFSPYLSRPMIYASLNVNHMNPIKLKDVRFTPSSGHQLSATKEAKFMFSRHGSTLEDDTHHTTFE